MKLNVRSNCFKYKRKLCQLTAVDRVTFGGANPSLVNRVIQVVKGAKHLFVGSNPTVPSGKFFL